MLCGNAMGRHDMRVLITGGAGFLGQKLATALARHARLPDAQGRRRELTGLTLLDVCRAPAPPGACCPVEVIEADLADADALAAALGPAPDLMFHLAAVVSSAAEADFDLGMRVNLDATRVLLDACRALPRPPRFVFASSIAAYGDSGGVPVTDRTALQPRSSYGIQKAIGELLVLDYTRRGFIDGLALRFPTITVRPGRPNRAASSFASSILREPLQGDEAVLPVPKDLALYVQSPRLAVANLMHAATLTAAEMGERRCLMLPGLRVTVAEMLAALERAAGAEALARVHPLPDAEITRIVGSWPADFALEWASSLGFERDTDIDSIVQAFIEDDLLR
jgi:D-erythronate 2-dehydrogenase